MDPRRDESPERRYYSTDRYVEEPETYEVGPAPPQPVKKKSKWKQIFSRKKGKKKVKETTTYDERSLPPVPSSTQPASFAEPLPPQPPFGPQSPVPASDVSTSRRYELRDPGFVRGPGPPRQMSITESRDESLRARSAVGSGSVFGQPRTTVVPPAEQDRFGPPPVVRRQRFEEERYAVDEGSVYDRGPEVMLIDQQSGNRVPRDFSYASTGSQRISATGPTKKKKRSLGGTLKRMFKRKKKPAEAVQPITVHPPSHHSYEIEQDGYPPEEVYEPGPGVVIDRRSSPHEPAAPLVIPPPAPAVVPAPASDRTRSSRSSARVVSEPPAVVVVPSKAPSSRGSAPPVVSPRSSHSRSSRSALPDVQVPITPRTSIPVRTGTGGSSTLYRPGTATAPPQRYPTGSSYGFGRRGTPVAPPRDLTPESSESPSIRSVPGDADRSWGEVRLPAEPPLSAAPVRAPTRAPTTSRPGGLGLGPKPITTTRPYVPRARPARPRVRYPTAPAPRAPYVHVPRPIPPPPVYPTMPTLPRTGAGLEAQVHLIVTALRDLAAEDRHRTAVAEQRMAEERAWNEEERARDAELRDLVVHLARRSAAFEAPRPTAHRTATGLEGLGSARTTPELGTAAPLGTTAAPMVGEFGVREQVGIAAGGLGVGGSDVERLILIMRQGHEVTMQTFRQLIETWRKDIDIKHEEFLAEMKAREAARERRREKPIRWQPGVNIWQPA